jgi:hypothetical protein
MFYLHAVGTQETAARKIRRLIELKTEDRRPELKQKN